MRAKLEPRAEGYVVVITMSDDELKALADGRGLDRVYLDAPHPNVGNLAPTESGKTELVRAEFRVSKSDGD